MVIGMPPKFYPKLTRLIPHYIQRDIGRSGLENQGCRKFHKRGFITVRLARQRDAQNQGLQQEQLALTTKKWNRVMENKCNSRKWLVGTSEEVVGKSVENSHSQCVEGRIVVNHIERHYKWNQGQWTGLSYDDNLCYSTFAQDGCFMKKHMSTWNPKKDQIAIMMVAWRWELSEE